jgi:16S rRNA U1498 N3-methylase RsmE
MSRYDFTTQRLFIDAPLSEGARIVMDKGQTNYLVNVLRMREGDPVLILMDATASGRRPWPRQVARARW